MLVVCAGVLRVLLLSSAALGDMHAVAKPETQTVAINGTAAELDGSDSYTDEEMPISDWAWDFDGDGGTRYDSNGQERCQRDG